jgi:hypothetical protein
MWASHDISRKTLTLSVGAEFAVVVICRSYKHFYIGSSTCCPATKENGPYINCRVIAGLLRGSSRIVNILINHYCPKACHRSIIPEHKNISFNSNVTVIANTEGLESGLLSCSVSSYREHFIGSRPQRTHLCMMTFVSATFSSKQTTFYSLFFLFSFWATGADLAGTRNRNYFSEFWLFWNSFWSKGIKHAQVWCRFISPFSSCKLERAHTHKRTHERARSRPDTYPQFKLYIWGGYWPVTCTQTHFRTL